MHLLRWVHKLLIFSGCRQPEFLKHSNVKFLYNVYTVLVVFLVHALLLSEILDLILTVENQDDFSDNIYLTLGMIVTSSKICSMLRNKKKIVSLVELLQKKPFSPSTAEEEKICAKFDRISEWNAIMHTLIVIVSGLGIYALSLSADFHNKQLRFRAWIPYDHMSQFSFNVTYVCQFMTVMIAGITNVTCENLFSGLMTHTISQFEILEFRLQNLEKNESHLVRQCAHHHKQIYKFATMINEKFKVIVFIQFTTSVMSLCTSLYRFTQDVTRAIFLEVLLFALCTIIQIFYYCWYANEAKLKSLELPQKILDSDWTSLQNDTKKVLLMIMRRATVPIEISSSFMVKMDIESFKIILKTSYSAFNMLRQNQ